MRKHTYFSIFLFQNGGDAKFFFDHSNTKLGRYSDPHCLGCYLMYLSVKGIVSLT